MIRTLNFAFIAITGLVCLGLYRIAEEARASPPPICKRRARRSCARNDALTVLGAEWARLTQPERIQALAQRHLDLSDQPEAQLSSLTQLCRRRTRRSCRKTRYATPKRWCRSHCATPNASVGWPRRNRSPLPSRRCHRFALHRPSHGDLSRWKHGRLASSLVRSRIALAALFCAACFSIIAARLVDVMVFGAGVSNGRRSGYSLHPMRADLVDREGVLIARDLPVSDLYATPAAFWDTSEAAHELAQAPPARTKPSLKPAFAAEARLHPGAAWAYAGSPRCGNASGLAGTGLRRPLQALLSGRAHRFACRGPGRHRRSWGFGPGARIETPACAGPRDIAPVVLSLDMRVQYVLEHEIEEAAHAFKHQGRGRHRTQCAHRRSSGPRFASRL